MTACVQILWHLSSITDFDDPYLEDQVLRSRANRNTPPLVFLPAVREFLQSFDPAYKLLLTGRGAVLQALCELLSLDCQHRIFFRIDRRTRCKCERREWKSVWVGLSREQRYEPGGVF